jgi:hypothetical protein
MRCSGGNDNTHTSPSKSPLHDVLKVEGGGHAEGACSAEIPPQVRR